MYEKGYYNDEIRLVSLLESIDRWDEFQAEEEEEEEVEREREGEMESFIQRNLFSFLTYYYTKC
ncbi:hypothetical protein BCON_0090g00260 [Botryotinia convoluta]|uniref:Uncharacterized protein n=1 Tax=Botryotinia convoluta TaxID=54673 RepID=A0A4Z1I818_9HELO|nr:hypothetical protein BCON_0090g00260 [Botryotinia convoluta]